MFDLKKGHTKELFDAQWHPDTHKLICNFAEDAMKYVSAFEIDDETMRIKAVVPGISHARAKQQAIETLSGTSTKLYGQQYKELLESLSVYGGFPLWTFETPRLDFKLLPKTNYSKKTEIFQPKKMYQLALLSLQSSSRWLYLKENKPLETIFKGELYRDLFMEYFNEYCAWEDVDRKKLPDLLVQGLLSMTSDDFVDDDVYTGRVELYKSYAQKNESVMDLIHKEMEREYEDFEDFEEFKKSEEYLDEMQEMAEIHFKKLNYWQLCELYGDHTQIFSMAFDAIGYKKEYRDELYNELLILSLIGVINLKDFGRRLVNTLLFVEAEYSEMQASKNESVSFLGGIDGSRFSQKQLQNDFKGNYSNIHVCVSISPDKAYYDRYDRYLDDSNLFAVFYTELPDGTHLAIGKIEAQYIVPLVRKNVDKHTVDDEVEWVPDLFIYDYTDLGAFRTLMERFVPLYGAIIKENQQNGWTFGYYNAMRNADDSQYYSGAIMDIKAFEFANKEAHQTDFDLLPSFLKLLIDTIGNGEDRPEPVGSIVNYETDVNNYLLFPIQRSPSVVLMEVGTASKDIYEKGREEYSNELKRVRAQNNSDMAEWCEKEMLEWDMQDANALVFKKALKMFNESLLPFMVYYHESNPDFSHPFVLSPTYNE